MFMALPLIQSLELAFFEWNGLRPREYVALENFEDLFDDRFFWGALRHTLIFAVFCTLGTVGIGLLLAMAISRRVRGAAFYRFLFYLPVMLPMAVTAALWVRMYEQNFGMLNVMLRSIGLEHLRRHLDRQPRDGAGLGHRGGGLAILRLPDDHSIGRY